MVKSINLFIPMEPVAKGRPKHRVDENGNHHTYTPPKTREAQDFIAWCVKEAGCEPFPRFLPLKLSVTFYRQHPKNPSKEAKKCKMGKYYRLFPVVKPDLNNLLATLQDGLNEWAYDDDRQITTLSASKRWTDEEHPEPGIEVNLEEDRG